MMQNVSDEAITASDAAGIIIAQLQAFNFTAEDSIHVVDSINEVANSFSVSSGDLASSLGVMSAAMAAGNVSFEEALGFRLSRSSKIGLIDGEVLILFLPNYFSNKMVA